MKNKKRCVSVVKNDTAPIRIKIGNLWLYSNNEMNVLGVTFDSKLK
jgi:hypothetical protein